MGQSTTKETLMMIIRSSNSLRMEVIFCWLQFITAEQVQDAMGEVQVQDAGWFISSLIMFVGLDIFLFELNGFYFY